MGSDQTVLIVIMVAVLALIGIGFAYFTLASRRRREQLHRAGPGSPELAVPDDPWRRFSTALAAVYARAEWQKSRDQRGNSAEQTYYGYGSVLSLSLLGTLLARDWQVRSPKTAMAKIGNAVSEAISDASALAADRGEDAFGLSARLRAAGVPGDAAALLSADLGTDRTREELPTGAEAALAFDIVRSANLVRWAGCLGLITGTDARDASDLLGAVAVSAFDSWDAFGQTYLAGLSARTSVGAKPYRNAVDWLQETPDSPWRQTPWPTAGTS